jgi:hypothetical protein
VTRRRRGVWVMNNFDIRESMRSHAERENEISVTKKREV